MLLGHTAATFGKELLLLRRDRAGLAVLFLMPAVLVLVVSLVQNNILETTASEAVQIGVVNEDDSRLAADLVERLRHLWAVEVEPTFAAAQTRMADGNFPFLLRIPAGFGRGVETAATAAVRQSLGQAEVEPGATTRAGAVPDRLELWFDPTVQGAFRTAVSQALEQLLLGLEVAAKARQLSAHLQDLVVQLQATGAPLPEGLAAVNLEEMLGGPRLLGLSVSGVGGSRTPNAVQQNVPAWSLFGMFFIVVPLAGNLIRETTEGPMQRILSLPVSLSSLLLGKILAYVLVCLAQFGLMLLVGCFLLPRFGTPGLVFEGRLAEAWGLAVCCALAAASYGIAVGTVAKTYEQASLFGALSVVIAAAVGGIMVPVYLMPPAMQALARFSPLSWGMNGFLELLVRGDGLGAIADNALALLGFFAANLALARLAFVQRMQR